MCRLSLLVGGAFSFFRHRSKMTSQAYGTHVINRLLDESGWYSSQSCHSCTSRDLNYLRKRKFFLYVNGARSAGELYNFTKHKKLPQNAFQHFHLVPKQPSYLLTSHACDSTCLNKCMFIGYIHCPQLYVVTPPHQHQPADAGSDFS